MGKTKREQKIQQQLRDFEDILSHENTENKVEKKSLVQDILGFYSKKLKIKAKNENQKILSQSIKDLKKEIIIADGPAGTGKTFIALVQSLSLLLNKSNDYTNIILFKSKRSMLNEDIGHLPGDVDDKLKLIMLSYLIQLEKLISTNAINSLVNTGVIRILPLSNIRGCSFSKDTIAIIDEFQNLPIDSAKTVLTRMESGSKLIVIGDRGQTDIYNKKESALKFVVDRLENLDDKIKVIKFTDEDVVRNELIKKITKAFES